MIAPLPPVRVSPDLYATLERHARESLEAVRVVADDGTPLYFPDGSGQYAALWTRDFCYMVEGAGHLMPSDEILGCMDYLLAGQREFHSPQSLGILSFARSVFATKTRARSGATVGKSRRQPSGSV